MSPFLFSYSMIKTKMLIVEIADVPREWVFEYYLTLSEKLCGQDIKISSVFNSADKRPSMYIYFSKSKSYYMFKDFSTGTSGDGVSLVQAMHKLSTRGESAHKIIEDYNRFILTNKEDYSLREFKMRSKYKVVKFTTRSWTNMDQKYWTKYHIGSKLLEFYKVTPLSMYTMSKIEDEEDKELVVKGLNIYGYFRKDGTLYKIYQPMVREYKFIKVWDYIQGMDQLTMNVDYLLICSSLKDIMSFSKLRIKNVEAIAPDSENILIPEHVITSLKYKYKSVITMFDNDEAGISSMKKYKAKYDVPSVHLEMEKDVSDAIKFHGINKVRDILIPLLTKTLKQCKKEDFILVST